MIDIAWRRMVLAGTIGLVGWSSACSTESQERASALSSSPLLQSVPDDATDFRAEALVDRNGNVTSRRIVLEGAAIVPGFDHSALPKKVVPAAVPLEKVSPVLAERLRPFDPKATTEIIVAVAHDAPFQPLPKLLRDEPRTSAGNQQRLATRATAIATVDARRKPFRNSVATRARALGGVVTAEFTMGNALAMTVPDAAVAELARRPDVVSIIPRYDGTPPPATIADGTSLATGMNSDFWRPWNDGLLSFFYVALLDSGVRGTHTVFSAPDGGPLMLHRDCANVAASDTSCLNIPTNPLYNDQDPTWNHGTSSANIIMGGNSSSSGFGLPFRGASRTELDYINVYTATTGDGLAIQKAFTLASNWGDDLIVAEIQAPFNDASALSLSADDAFDLGIAVIGACGNNGQVTSPAAPGNAHKALSIGDYHATSGLTVSQVPGWVDDRIKPDLQAPTGADAAGNTSDTATKFAFGGTSGATAFAAGAAALMYEWNANAFGLTNKPGSLYTALLAQGDAGTQPGITTGAGKLKMKSGSFWITGQITLGTSTSDLTWTIPAGYKDLRVAIWWPERQNQAHDDIDLNVLAPGGASLGTSTWSGSVWEKVSQTGNLAAGTYTTRFVPFSMPRTSQVVYYTMTMSHQ